MRAPRTWTHEDPRTKDQGKRKFHPRDKRWRVQYEDPEWGYKRRTRGGFKTKKDAQAWVDWFKESVAKDEWVDLAQGRRTFEDVAKQWVNSRTFSKANTEAGYRHIISGEKSLLNVRFGSVPIGSITHADIDLWVGEMSVTKKPSTVRNNFYVLRKIMKFAVRARVIPRDPSQGIENLPAITKVNHAEEGRYPLTISQMDAIVGALPEPWDMYTRLVAATGMRPEEVVGLQLRHVDTESGVVKVRQVWVRGRYERPKTPLSTRTIKLDTFTTGLLAAYLDAHRARALAWFTAHPGHEHPGDALPLFVGVEPLGRGNYARKAAPDIERLDFSVPADHTAFVTRYWRSALAAAGLPGSIRFYDLRHAHASMIAAQIGKPGALTLKECQERMGHSNMATFYDRYVKSPEDEDDRQRKALDALWTRTPQANVVPMREAN